MKAGGAEKFFLGCAAGILTALLCAAANAPEAKPVSLVEKAKDLQKRGRYQKAIKIYERILKKNQTKPSPDGIEEIRKDYEILKIKLLLSKAKHAKELDYTVAEGDTLYELARKYGTTTDLIKGNNGLKTDWLYPGMKLKIVQGVFTLQIDKSRNRLFLLIDGNPVKRYRVATGAEDKTPAGTFKIVNKIEQPTWYRTGAVVPSGSPDNSLGSRWLGFDLKGYGIHGTLEPESIGKHVSLGCIRMLNEDVEELYSLLPLDTEVTIAK